MKSIANAVYAGAVCLLAGTFDCQVVAQWSGPGGAQAELKSGKQLETALAQTGNCLWRDTPLRTALGSFSRVRGVATIIDRRTDPGQSVSLQLTDASGTQILATLAEKHSLGFCFFRSVAYFGPRSATDRIRTVGELRRQEIRQMGTKVARRFLASKPSAWKDLATPRDLLTELARENGFEIAGMDRVHHDLWAAAGLPEMSVADRLTIILSQFDLTFAVSEDGSSISLVEMPKRPVLVRNYPGGRNPDDLAAKWAKLVPEARFKVVDGKVYVQGRLEDHERIDGSLRPAPRKPPAPGPANLELMRFTITAPNQPLEHVLKQFAEQLKLELKLDRPAFVAAGISPDVLVSFSVEDGTFDELMDAVVKPAGCSWRREGGVLIVRPVE